MTNAQKKDDHRSERGQVLVFILLAIGAIFGFAALAVDGGRVMAERRRAQNAADSAALAAAFAYSQNESLTNTQLRNIAWASALENGYENTKVVFHRPPASPSPYAGNNEYYQVEITSSVDPIFVQFVYNGPLATTVQAIARSKSITPISTGNAVHAVTENGIGVEFKGNVDVTVNGGNVFSNSDDKKAGVPGSLAVNGGSVILHGTWDGDTSNISPQPTQNVPIQQIPDLPEPVCPTAAGTVSATAMTPGIYATDPMINATQKITMAPGIYCFQNGITVNGGGEIYGKNILIVMLGGDVQLNGSGKVTWIRASNLLDSAGQQWGGMLIYVPRSNTEEVYLTGGNDTIFKGTIYAPSSECEIGGEAETLGLFSNLVCNNVLFNGNPNITLNYKQPQNYQMPPIIELTQ